MRKLVIAFNLLLAATATAQVAVQVWAQRYNGTGNFDDKANAIAVYSNLAVYVTGYSAGVASTNDFATVAYSSAGIPLWTNRFNGAGNGDDRAVAMVVDGVGKVFVTGYTTVADGTRHFATIAYSSSGIPLWTNFYGGPGGGNDLAVAIAADKDGNVYVTGTSQHNISSGSEDYATIAYSNSGLPLWTNRYDGPGAGPDMANSVAVDDDGQVYVTGSSEGGNTNLDYATIAYSGLGVALWTNRYNGLGNYSDAAKAVAVDSSGSVFVTGLSVGFSGHLSPDIATIKYSHTGETLWTNFFGVAGGLHNADANAIAVDGDGDVLVTGAPKGIGFGGDLGDYAIVKYSGAGVPLWTNRYDSVTHGLSVPSAVAVDRVGNVYLTGSANSDYATVAYSSSGASLWTNTCGGLANRFDSAAAIAVDCNGNVYVTGYSTNNGTGYDYATIRYSAGVPVSLRASQSQVILSWTNSAFGWTNLDFALQSAPTSTGTFTNIPGATSPYTNSITGAQQFFRLISN